MPSNDVQKPDPFWMQPAVEQGSWIQQNARHSIDPRDLGIRGASEVPDILAKELCGNKAWRTCGNQGDRHFTHAPDFVPGQAFHINKGSGILILIGDQGDRHFASIEGQAFHFRSGDQTFGPRDRAGMKPGLLLLSQGDRHSIFPPGSGILLACCWILSPCSWIPVGRGLGWSPSRTKPGALSPTIRPHFSH